MKVQKVSTIGSDKIWYSVASGGVRIKQGSLKSEGWAKNYECTEIDGHNVRIGAKFYGEEKGTGNVRVFVDLRDMSAKVQYNPSKVFTDHVLTTDILKSHIQIESRLKASGIEIDRDSCKVTRKDIACDSVLLESPNMYMDPLTNYLRFKRSKSNAEYPTGRTFGNASVQMQFYNKHKQLNMLKVTHEIHCNTARNEFRMLSNAKGLLQKYTPTMAETLKLTGDDLRDIYLYEVRDRIHLARTQANEEIRLQTLRDEMQYYMTNYGRNWQQQMILNRGYEDLLSEYGHEDYLSCLVGLDDSKTMKNEVAKVKNRISQISEFETMKKNFKGRSQMSYVNEYIEAFAS